MSASHTFYPPHSPVSAWLDLVCLQAPARYGRSSADMMAVSTGGSPSAPGPAGGVAVTPRTSPSQTPPTQPGSLCGEAQPDAIASPALLSSPLGANSLAGQAAVVQLLQALGCGHSLLAQYKSREAIAAFGALPAQQYQTSWVLSQVGKAYFELVDYAQALHFFTWSRNQDPYRVEGLEWHSTVLWHMKKEVLGPALRVHDDQSWETQNQSAHLSFPSAR